MGQEGRAEARQRRHVGGGVKEGSRQACNGSASHQGGLAMSVLGKEQLVSGTRTIQSVQLHPNVKPPTRPSVQRPATSVLRPGGGGRWTRGQKKSRRVPRAPPPPKKAKISLLDTATAPSASADKDCVLSGHVLSNGGVTGAHPNPAQYGTPHPLSRAGFELAFGRGWKLQNSHRAGLSFARCAVAKVTVVVVPVCTHA